MKTEIHFKPDVGPVLAANMMNGTAGLVKDTGAGTSLNVAKQGDVVLKLGGKLFNMSYEGFSIDSQHHRCISVDVFPEGTELKITL